MPRGEEREDRRRSALLEIALPIVALVLVGTVAVLLGGGDVERRIRSMGWWFHAVTGAGITGLAGTCTLLWLKRRGRRVPDALTAFFAVLPWLTGLGGMRFGMHTVLRAVEHADWSSRGAMSVVGYAEASASAAYGQLVSMALLSAMAVVLAVRASGDRSRVFVSAVVVVTALAIVGPALVAQSAVAMILVPIVAALVAFGAGAGRPGAPAVAIAVSLATIATSSAAILDMRFRAFVNIGRMDSTTRDALFEEASRSLLELDRAVWIVIGATTLAALVVLGESLRRTDKSMIARIASLVGVALCVLALHRVAMVSSMRAVEASTSVPWHEIEGFELVRTPGDWAPEPLLVVDAEGELRLGGTRLPTERVALFEALEQERQRREELQQERYDGDYEEETPEWLEEPVEDHGGRGKRARASQGRRHSKKGADRYGIETPDEAPDDDAREEMRDLARVLRVLAERPLGGPEGCALGGRGVSAAIDARVAAMRLFTLLDATGQVTIVGRRRAAPSDALEGLTLLANVRERDSLGEFSVSTPRGECDPNTWYDIIVTASLGADPLTVLRDYESGAELMLSDLEYRRREQPNGHLVVFLRPDEDATVQHLADFASTIREMRDRTDLVLVRTLPQRPPTPPLPTELAESVRDAHIELGRVHATGGLSRDVARPVVETGGPQLDLCGQRALTANPELAADLHVSVRVAANGHVRSARTDGGSSAFRALRACMSDAMQQWTFPSNAEETHLVFWARVGEPDPGVPQSQNR